MVWQLAVGKFVSLDNPGMSDHLLRSQSLMGVHVKHLGHEILQGARIKCEADTVTEEDRGYLSSYRSCQSYLELYLGGVGHGVPVASRQTEVTVAYPVQDLVRGVLGSVGKGSKTGGRHR